MDGHEGPPLDRLLELEGTGGSSIPYLGYVEVNLQMPGIRVFNEDVLLMVIPMTTYAEKVPVMVGSKGNGNDYKRELAEQPQPGCILTLVWLCLGCSSCPTNVQGDRGSMEGVTPSVVLKPTAPKEF